MLKQLSIKNLAIIDDLIIDFNHHLNVLTGETGAGKSIIIDAISLIFGSRANSEIIAANKDSATISASLEINEDLAQIILNRFDLDVKDEFIISRYITANGKSNIKINGVITPLYVLNEIGQLLIDISSQNESQYLLHHKNHLTLLDNFIKSEIKDFKNEYDIAFLKYEEILKKIEEANQQSLDDEEREYLKFKYNELKKYEYSVEDEISIQEEYKNLNALSKNLKIFETFIDSFNDERNGVLPNYYQAIKSLSRLEHSQSISNFEDKFNSLYLDLTDLVSDFKKEFSIENIDESRIEFLSNEITKINQMKRKYKVNDILLLKEKIEKQLSDDEQKEIILSKLNKQLDVQKNIVIKLAKEISLIRQKYAEKLSLLVQNELADLYLKDAVFSIVFHKCELNKVGLDDVAFYMSANKGVPPMPLIKVASGGEISRIMLGLKSVFAKYANKDIVIFDEIDSGVSGKVALAMGKKMEKIAMNSQVLAITHLPQVAAMSDHHYYIYKENKNNKTRTIVKPLSDISKVNEVARLLSGDNITDNFINAAKELISSK